MTNHYEGVQEVIQISTNISKGCKHCSEGIGGEDNLAHSINHFINNHEYKLLHVGTETTYTDEGKLWYSTIAVLGR